MWGRWVRIGDQEYSVRYLKPASKGDTIFGIVDQWLIAVNFPWELAEKLNDSSFTVFAETIKEVPERHFSLIKVTKVEKIYERIREEVEHKDPEEYEFHGIRIKTGSTTVTKIREEVKEVWTPETREFREEEVEEKSRHSYTDKRTTYEIVKENGVTNLIRKSEHFWIRDPLNGFSLRNYYNSVTFEKLEGIDEQTLLDLSKYYVIAYPFLTCKLNDTYYHAVHIYYNGRKLEVPFTNFDDELPPTLHFRITLRRFAITRHYKSLLPYGNHFYNLEDFLEFAKEAHEKVKELEGRIKVKEISPFERFLEIFYIRTPKRKFKAVEPHFKLYEKLLETLKDKPTLYISFPNKYGLRGANYACIRVNGDEFTVMGIAQVPATAITIRGKFEEAYKIVHSLKKLLSYQFAPKEKKIQMIKEDIEALRREIEERLNKPVTELHPEYDIMKYLFSRAENYEGDNLVLLLYKARRLEKAPSNVTLLKLAGLIKSGKGYDYTVERLKDVLEALRIAVKYEIKKKGYSTKLGVVFTGTAYEIAKKVVETVNRVNESRLKALLAEILTDYEKSSDVTVSLGRLEALMKELE